MTAGTPRLSFGVPVRNAEKTIGRTLDSLLAQDFGDFEVVISDNDSTDTTQGICEGYASRDPRVRYFRNEEDVGQIQNFNSALDLSRGEYLRWIGAEDVLDPRYAGKCIAVLDENPDAVGVTTLWEFIDDRGMKHTSDYRGERLEAPGRLRRLARLLWFQTEDRLHLDPIYSMMRREALLQANGLPISSVTDHVLSLEMVLRGHFCHVPEILACRKLPRRATDFDALLRKYHPSLRGRDRSDFGVRAAEFRRVVAAQGLQLPERLGAYALIWYFRFRAKPYLTLRRLQGRVTRFSKRIFGSA